MTFYAHFDYNQLLKPGVYGQSEDGILVLVKQKKF